ncbi:hypothetical protein ACH95_04005 [Bacillus glycinifermentans]|uniref:Uncharacterized protein n=1 Tax=Bacillus glycinifermentans TaxID=1664069 RepID=A0A0J6EIN1_9BACI|nr:hypothetical protein COP00_17785 [Bacillus glycinifermentans]KMM63096.1 hypothetical protein ACH95_04005 [Bacillus glycinifermentans]KRT95656.1 hypothetical protein AB447_200660 [Bacillus glycinifermentans]
MFSPLSRETYRKDDPFPYVCERIVFAIKKGGTARPSSFCGEGFFAFFKGGDGHGGRLAGAAI